jgi:hypothetical protein
VKRVIVVKLEQNRNWIVEQGQKHLAYKYKRKRLFLLGLVFQSLDYFSPNSIIFLAIIERDFFANLLSICESKTKKNCWSFFLASNNHIKFMVQTISPFIKTSRSRFFCG